MLGVKATCKDRWRQVLNEAARVPRKHLLTLEPGISQNQTREMGEENVQLVIPLPIQPTFRAAQLPTLMSVEGFIAHVKARQ